MYFVVQCTERRVLEFVYRRMSVGSEQHIWKYVEVIFRNQFGAASLISFITKIQNWLISDSESKLNPPEYKL
jgi:hypothetical protein